MSTNDTPAWLLKRARAAVNQWNETAQATRLLCSYQVELSPDTCTNEELMRGLIEVTEHLMDDLKDNLITRNNRLTVRKLGLEPRLYAWLGPLLPTYPAAFGLLLNLAAVVNRSYLRFAPSDERILQWVAALDALFASIASDRLAFSEGRFVHAQLDQEPFMLGHLLEGPVLHLHQLENDPVRAAQCHDMLSAQLIPVGARFMEHLRQFYETSEKDCA